MAAVVSCETIAVRFPRRKAFPTRSVANEQKCGCHRYREWKRERESFVVCYHVAANYRQSNVLRQTFEVLFNDTTIFVDNNDDTFLYPRRSFLFHLVNAIIWLTVKC